MPNKQRHRGPSNKDHLLFSDKELQRLRLAIQDYEYLLSRGYPAKASLKLTGDHFRFTERQRNALMHTACAGQAAALRKQREYSPQQMQGQTVWIDGYNLLITLEAALSKGPLFQGRDGCVRDISSIHGSYKKVEETLPALHMIYRGLQELQVGKVHWLMDAPVSNSGRLCQLIREIATEYPVPTEAEVDMNPDRTLSAKQEPIVSTDSWILDHPVPWFNFNAWILQQTGAEVWLMVLSKE